MRRARVRRFLREAGAAPRTYTPTTLNGEKTFGIVDRFSPDFSEALYGLGQHQSGMFNYRGSTVELGQNNTDIAVPVLVSSKGYGILWNTAAFTMVGNRFPLELSFDSMAGDGVDYFVMYGPEMDGIIHEYRNLTGHAPMLPRWSYGYIQSKDRYMSLDEIETIAARYRSEHIPMDAMVQDWFWWKTEGDPVFNQNYKDVPADLAKLHDEHVHTMISTWGLLDPASETFKKMDAEGLLVPNAHVYDASSERARNAYWENLPGKLFAQGWDSFWLDSAEPEEYYPHGGDAILRDKKMAIGSGGDVHECVSSAAYGGDPGELAEDVGGEADVPADAVGVSGAAAGGRDGVVGGCVQQLLGIAAAGAGGVELRVVGSAVLDYGYRRVSPDLREPDG